MESLTIFREKRPRRRQPNDHHFWSLMDSHSHRCGFPAGNLGGHEGAFCLSSRVSNPLKTDWQKHVLPSSGYLELGMIDDAAMALEEIAPEDKNRNEVLGARVNLYMVARRSRTSAVLWHFHLRFGQARLTGSGNVTLQFL